jgi:septum formation protein
MLEAAGVRFETVEAELDEGAAKAGLWGAGFDARGVAEELAQLKALSVEAGEDCLVLGSDQTLETADGTLLGKPASREEAWGQLSLLRGATHHLHSAAVVAEAGEAVWWNCETVSLSMRSFSDEFLHAYLDAEWEQIRWSVGGERVEGSHFAILGLPLLPLLGYLRERGLLKS